VPPLLDHVILGCNDLERGIAFVEEHTGVRAAFGGVHPGRGTQNALVSLGERRYLEIIAPDPKQPEVKQYTAIRSMTTPGLIGWAAHPGDIEVFAKRLRDAGIAMEAARAGSRSRPDGRVLTWKSVALSDDAKGLLPFFIEWGAESIHPSKDSPAGCRQAKFTLVSPDADALTKLVRLMGIDVSIEKGNVSRLSALFVGLKGQLDMLS
jgi:catechol 2,3-dioxygenase-like lactoylglutathione lyase family enzyme